MNARKTSQEASQVTAGCAKRGPQKRPCHVLGSAHAGLPPCAEATTRLCTPEEHTRGHEAHIAVNRGFGEQNAREARKLHLSSLPGTVLTHPGHAALQGALVTRPLGGRATRASYSPSRLPERMAHTRDPVSAHSGLTGTAGLGE